jgi:Secretion system C-terminal sorting domain
LSTDISSARLRLFGGLDSLSTAPLSIEVYNVPNWRGWLENTISFSNKPPASSAMLSSTMVGAGGQYHEWDLTQHIIELRKAGVYYFSLMVKNDAGTGNNLAYFNSRENKADKPELVVSTNPLITEANRGSQNIAAPMITSKTIVGNDPVISLGVYPNPVTNSFTLRYSPELRNRKLNITDINGKLLKQVNLAGEGTQFIRVDGFKAGVYFLSVAANNRKYTQKLMIRN